MELRTSANIGHPVVNLGQQMHPQITFAPSTCRLTGWVKTSLRSQGAAANLEPFLFTLIVPDDPVSHSCHSAVWSWHVWYVDGGFFLSINLPKGRLPILGTMEGGISRGTPGMGRMG